MRLVGLDIFRGVAIILMIVYHFIYNLHEFHYIDIDMSDSLHWRCFRALIVTMFLFGMGVSLHLSYGKGIDTKKLFKRVIILGAASLLISIVTYQIYPKSWVFFGIIHFITVATLIGLLFLNRPLLAFFSSITIGILYFADIVPYGWIVWKVAHFIGLPNYTVDFVPLIPWLWIVFFALIVAAKGWHIPLFDIDGSHKKSLIVLERMGQHSLLIYLVHLPVLYGLFVLVDLAFK